MVGRGPPSKEATMDKEPVRVDSSPPELARKGWKEKAAGY